MKRILTAAAMTCLFLLTFGCASTSVLVAKWSDPSIKKPEIHRVLVIAISKNQVSRRLWEDLFVSELEKHALVATASYRLLPDAVPSTNQIARAVEANGFDGILITHRLPIVTNMTYVPAYTTFEPDYVMTENRFNRDQYWPGYYHRRYGYNEYLPNYYTHYAAVEHAGYMEIQKYHCKSINVWTTGKDGRVIWSATSKSLEPETVTANTMEQARGDIVDLIMPSLVKHFIIPPAR